ncbi:shikimate dehydrogenase/3-dehydroquinate dehydratase / shikimate dehydrogenase [Thermodesulfobium acidiphilum]|uniref:Shikimate dehydrogenase (NADP(+)) n=1 Tax=Thermodesulfobium acidiphilum TaxID=1794699 RepID=A0A2R4W2I3_THEAF|nr:shikimate dehydrogenase [Thermodesulfobium acidiphilum]AWB10964.1 shikimate dehydrogenase/3-dehydroquinate dehydratase / shikimate dehydrogenase [Thermodesulfobium acidiphilum]PMP86875.1 MAG: shikimate dehydrogenase [Thermodesulfobium narugense]
MKRISGLIGKDISYSLSPAMHNRALEKLGIDAVYLLFDLEKENLFDFLKVMIDVGALGFNVTIPYKETIMDLIDWVDNDAIGARALNTIVLVDNKWCGYNTDIYGIKESFENINYDLKNKVVGIFGSGGVAKAAIYFFLKEGASVWVMGRSPEKIKDLSKLYGVDTLIWSEDLPYFDVLVNATPLGKNSIGMPPFPKNFDISGKVFFDMVYVPEYTPFLTEARKFGAFVISGIDMLLYQGVKAFELIFKVSPPIEDMKDELLKRVRSK